MDLIVLFLVNVPLSLLIGVAIYGTFAEFKTTLKGWLRRVFSLEILDGALFPPFGLQLWLYGTIAALWGGYHLFAGPP